MKHVSIEGGFATGLRRRFNRVFVATLGFFLLTHGGHFYSADNLTAYETARAFLKTGNLEILPGLGTVPGLGGRNYGHYGIGLSLLQAPLIAAGALADLAFPDTFRAIVGPNVSVYYPEDFSVFAASLVSPLFGALGAAEFWAAAELLGYPMRTVAWLTIILVTSTQFWPAARDSFPHIVVAGCLLLMACQGMTWRDARFTAVPIMVGCAAGLLILLRPFDAAISLPALAIYLLWQDWGRVWQQKRLLNSNLGRFLIPVAISIALVGLYNAIRFGSPLAFREGVGFTTPLRVGLYGLLLSTWRGVLFFSPPVAATIPGLIMMWRRRPAEALLFAALIAVFPLAYATYMEWPGGVCWGPRYIVPAVPFAVLPLGELLMMGGVAMTLVVALGLAGLVVQLAGTMVDFQRVQILFPASYSQIVVHWQALLAGKYLDWLPLRLYATHGLLAAIAYAAAPFAMVAWGTISLRKLLRTADVSADVS